MKPLLVLAMAFVLSAAGLRADDLVSPKPPLNQTTRVLLHVNGSPRPIDFPDVFKILCSEPSKIVFETSDGYTVVHQGTYTVIQQKSVFADHQARGIRFYDAK